jgi:hypothetical protein
MTAHLNRPPGSGAYLRRQPASNIPDQQVLAHQVHPDAEEYPYDSEADEVISKSRKRVSHAQSKAISGT